MSAGQDAVFSHAWALRAMHLFGALFLGNLRAKPLVFSDDEKAVQRHLDCVIAPSSMLADRSMSESGSKKSQIVDGYLPENFFLKREVISPTRQRKRLAALAHYDLLRRTPFKAGEVVSLLGEPHRSEDRFLVTQWVARSRDLDDLRRRLKAAGLVLRRVYVQGSQDLGPLSDYSDNIVPNAMRWRLANASLFVLAISLFTAQWLYPTWVLSQETKALELRAEELRGDTVALRQQLGALELEKAERDTVLDGVLGRPRLVDVLRAATIGLPDTVWISDMQFQAGEIVLSGEISGSAAELVLAMSDLELLENSRLSGPVSRTAAGRERFELTLAVTGLQ